MDICKLKKTHMNNLQIVLIDILRVQRSKNLLGVRRGTGIIHGLIGT